MIEEPEESTSEQQSEPSASVLAPVPLPVENNPAPESTVRTWEDEVDAFWQNLCMNVMPRLDTDVHNFIHAEKESLKARLKAFF